MYMHTYTYKVPLYSIAATTMTIITEHVNCCMYLRSTLVKQLTHLCKYFFTQADLVLHH